MYVVDSGVGGRILRLTRERVEGRDPLFQESFGHLLETFVVGEVRKALSWLGEPFQVGYWRDRGGSEVDLVVERLDDRAVVAMEVKSASRISTDDWKGLRRLRGELGSRFHAGMVLYTGEMPYQLDERIYGVPIDKLWHGEPETPRPARPRTLLTADGDPLPEAVRAATDQMVERLDLGAAAWWEVALVPSSNVSFQDFYSPDGIAGALGEVEQHSIRGVGGFGLGRGSAIETIEQCLALVEKGRRGVLIHPLGAMVAVAAGTPGFLGHGKIGNDSRRGANLGVAREWTLEFTRFAHRVLLPHGPGLSWTFWSRGRLLLTGRPQLHVGPKRSRAMVDNPLPRGIPSTDDPGAEAFHLTASFFEWFGIPTARLPSADTGRITADNIWLDA